VTAAQDAWQPDASQPARGRRVLVVHCPAWTEADAQPRGFEQVVTAVEQFCPHVEVLHPGLCAIRVRGPARYFGGERRLAELIAEAVGRIGSGCQIGVADGLFAARLAATHGSPRSPAVIVPPGTTPDFLAPQPVAVLGDPQLADLLPRLGISTLGEYAGLPAAEVLDRFGVSGLAAHRLARGLDPRPLIPRPPPADLSVQAEFDPAVDQAEPVVFAAKALAGQLHARLAAAGLTCVRLRVLIGCEDGQEIVRYWRHDGLLSELAVAERVRWQLEGWQAGLGVASRAGPGRAAEASPGLVAEAGHSLASEAGHSLASRTGPGRAAEADPGVASRARAAYVREVSVDPAVGITLLALIPDQLIPDHGAQLGLWGDAVITDRVARAALRVQAMLGHGAVRQPVLAGGRGPAEQALLVPFGDALTPERPADRPWPGRLPAPAPAAIYPAPRSASVIDGSGRPVTVTGRSRVSSDPAVLSVGGGPPLAVTAWAGPWPVDERWWDPSLARRKARFQLVTDDGSAWLAIVRNGAWMVEGSYD
jgi:protein ImuB